MIATHHIKVNGKWIHPGEAYGESEAKVAPANEVAETNVPTEEKQETTAEVKPARKGRKKAE